MSRKQTFLCLILFLTACVKEAALDSKDALDLRSLTLDTAINFPLKVKDALGRVVVLPAPCRRLVSLTPGNTEIIFAAGAGACLLADTSFCNFPAQAQSLPKIGGYAAETISLDKILLYNPDLVICGGKYHQSIITALNRFGVNAVAIEPTSPGEILSALLLVGAATGHQVQAQAKVRYLMDLQRRVRKLTAHLSDLPRVYWEINVEPLMSVGALSWENQMLRAAGGINIFASVKAVYPLIAPDEVLARDPDAIIVTYDRQIMQNHFASGLFGELTAVRLSKVFYFDPDIFSRPGPRVFNAMGLICRALHPQLFAAEFPGSDPALW